MALTLQTIIASTRPGRVGPSVAQWFHAFAGNHDAFDAQLVDLADFDLPMYNEPQHPRLQQYEHAHTRRWADSVAAADAYVFVTPEYNYSPTPALINALNYVYSEWNYKPCAFVSYGGVSGGLRAVQAARLQVTTLRMMPLLEGVTIPFVNQFLDDSGNFKAEDVHEQSAQTVLDELQRWAGALAPLHREQSRPAA